MSRHEDLYEEIVHNLIRSDDLFTNGDKALTERLFLGCRVVLCTLSMLSNPGLDNIGLFPLIPVNRLVVDEASQICVSEYMVRVVILCACFMSDCLLSAPFS